MIVIGVSIPPTASRRGCWSCSTPHVSAINSHSGGESRGKGQHLKHRHSLPHKPRPSQPIAFLGRAPTLLQQARDSLHGLSTDCPSDDSLRIRKRSVLLPWKQYEQDVVKDQLLHEKGHLIDAVEEIDHLVLQGSYVGISLLYTVLRRCIADKDLALGSRVHALTIQSGYECNVFLANHIICMYASHGKLEEALQVFTMVAAPSNHMWASIISAHVRHGQPARGIYLYQQMREKAVKPDNHIFVAVLKACAIAGNLNSGKQVHADILGSAIEPDMFVGSSLVDMYAKCGSLVDARRLFDKLQRKNVVTWTAMVVGYAKHGLGREALTLYASMRRDCMTPANNITFVGLLQACASVGAFQQGKLFHAQIQRRQLESDVVIGNSLVDMYAKCGQLEDARVVFDRMPTKDVVTWTAMINGYAQCNDAQKALHCFLEMQQHKVEPNDATFMCLLMACIQNGMVKEGQHYFKVMSTDFGIAPTVKHYTCMVDLLGRGGCLDEAEKLLRHMPFAADVVGWTSLLNACKLHGDIQRGEVCFHQVVALEPENSIGYVLLANIYANAGRWRDVDMIESLRKSAGAWKKPAKASIEVRNKVHEFTVGEEMANISSKLRSMTVKLKEGGHVPQTELVLKTLTDSGKEESLCGHAEKLALAYGLLNTQDGSSLLVTKNLLMCNDCHSSTKIMSRLEKRKIIVRDSHRVHTFVNGSCSCGDQH